MALEVPLNQCILWFFQ